MHFDPQKMGGAQDLARSPGSFDAGRSAARWSAPGVLGALAGDDDMLGYVGVVLRYGLYRNV